MQKEKPARHASLAAYAILSPRRQTRLHPATHRRGDTTHRPVPNPACARFERPTPNWKLPIACCNSGGSPTRLSTSMRSHIENAAPLCKKCNNSTLCYTNLSISCPQQWQKPCSGLVFDQKHGFAAVWKKTFFYLIELIRFLVKNDNLKTHFQIQI